jgi:NADH-quinone oxidoreductase subunit L
VLGVLSVVGGWINLPEFAHGLGATERLQHWLEPITAAGARISEGLGTQAVLPEGNVERWLVGLAITLAALGLLLVSTTLKTKPVPARNALSERGFWLVLYNKYYVDEVYDRYIVQPLIGLSRVVLWKSVDQGVIDGSGVNGAAALSRAIGRLGSRLQTGQIGVYMILFVVGAVFVLGMVAWR